MECEKTFEGAQQDHRQAVCRRAWLLLTEGNAGGLFAARVFPIATTTSTTTTRADQSQAVSTIQDIVSFTNKNKRRMRWQDFC